MTQVTCDGQPFTVVSGDTCYAYQTVWDGEGGGWVRLIPLSFGSLKNELESKGPQKSMPTPPPQLEILDPKGLKGLKSIIVIVP